MTLEPEGSTPLDEMAEGTLRVINRTAEGFRCLLKAPRADGEEVAAVCTDGYCSSAQVIAQGPDSTAVQVSCSRDDDSRCSINGGLLDEIEEDLDRRLAHARFLLDAAGRVHLDAGVRSAPAVETTRVVEVSPPDPLRPIEEETLEVALALGYYDNPRSATMDDIAEVLGISKSAVYHRLNRVEGKAIDRLMRER